MTRPAGRSEEAAPGLQHRHSQVCLPFGDLQLSVTHPDAVSRYQRQFQLPADVCPKHDREQITYDGDPTTALPGAPARPPPHFVRPSNGWKPQ